MITTLKELYVILERLINENQTIIISPHINPDVDAISSAIAVHMIAKRLGKKAYIIIDDTLYKLDSSIENVLKDVPAEVSIIRPNELERVTRGKRSLLITVDTNKENLVPFKDYSMFSDIIIIDHHEVGEKTIPTEYKYINTDMSSASEIMYNLLHFFDIKVAGRRNLPKKEGRELPIADYLLAGIALDTGKFNKCNVNAKTMKTASKLLASGASMEFVNDIFRSENASALKVHGLVSKTDIDIYNIAIAMNKDNPELFYTVVELAKAADYLIDLKGMDAAFVLGFIRDGLVGISARSKGNIPVGKVMSEFGGGGNNTQAAAKVETTDIMELKLRLEQVVRPGYKLL